MSDRILNADDAAALTRLRAHVAKRSANNDVRVLHAAGRWSCLVSYAADDDVSVTCVVAATATTPAAAILAAGVALGVAL